MTPASAESWVETMMSSLKCYCASLGVDESSVPRIALIMKSKWHAILAAQRHTNKLVEAQRGAEQLFTLAEQFTLAYRNHPYAYVLVAEACIQKEKNAFREDNPPATVLWAKKALDAANKAATFDPEDKMIRGFVAYCRQRLIKFERPDNNAAATKDRTPVNKDAA